MTYRPEIDGLRAIAVMAVILFHAGFSGLSGGYVGVDIFFVISGYLIGGILLREFSEGNFSYCRFYERRARRILPALITVVLCTLPVAWIVLLPLSLEPLGESLIATVLFLSNIYFWKESGYFSAAAELTPFLHTWSLAVEEQFYIFFPPLLALLFGARRALVPLLLGLFLISLACAEWTVRSDPQAAFFLPWFRVWELLAGVLLAARPAPVVNRDHADGLAGLGLLAIFASIVMFGENTHVPGLAGLLPVLGTTLVLAFARAGTRVAAILSVRPVVLLGLISYSAYLWHQPLLALARHATGGHLSASFSTGLVVLTLGFAWLSWRFVETPFRNASALPLRSFIACATLGSGVLLVFGLTLDKTDGLAGVYRATRFDEQERALYELVQRSIEYDLRDSMFADPAKPCMIWVADTDSLDPGTVADCTSTHGPATVLLGDSHGMNLYNVLAQTAAFPFLIGVAQGGCRLHDNRPDCHYTSFDRFLFEHREQVGTVLYHQSGSYLIADDRGRTDVTAAFEGAFGGFDQGAIDRLLASLSDMRARYALDLRWIGPFVEYRRSPEHAAFGIPDAMTVNPISRNLFRDLDALIVDTVNQTGIEMAYVPFDTLFTVPEEAFQGDCFLFLDQDHFSTCGEAWLAGSSLITRLP